MISHTLRRLSATALAVCALGAGTTAQAVDVNWGAHGPTRSVQQYALSFFVDTYSFSLGSGSWQVASAALSNEVVQGGNTVYSIIGGAYGLYADPDGTPESGDEALVGGTMMNFNGATGNLLNRATLSQGRYYYLVTGLGFGSAGGSYQLSSAVAAVPEPSTGALLLAGAATMGGIGLRRRKGRCGS